MKTFIAQMQTRKANLRAGKTLIELVLVVMIIGFLTMLAMMNMSGLVGKSQFQQKCQDLVNMIQMASDSAAKKRGRYEIVFDPSELTYLLRELVVDDGQDDQQKDLGFERVISDGTFDEDFMLSYVQFDDYEMATDEVSIFRVGHGGFQYGGKIVLFDSRGEYYSIVINRLNSTIKLESGDVDLWPPKDKDEMPF